MFKIERWKSQKVHNRIICELPFFNEIDTVPLLFFEKFNKIIENLIFKNKKRFSAVDCS
jgi:hypothetical protein